MRVEIELNDDELEVLAYKPTETWLHTKVAAAVASLKEDAARRRHLVTDENYEQVLAQYEDPTGEGISPEEEIALYRFIRFNMRGLWQIWVHKYTVRVAQLSLRGDLKPEE